MDEKSLESQRDLAPSESLESTRETSLSSEVETSAPDTKTMEKENLKPINILTVTEDSKEPSISTQILKLSQSNLPPIQFKSTVKALLKQNKRKEKSKKRLSETIKDMVYAFFMFIRSILPF